MIDKIKLAWAVLLVALGVWGYYWLGEQPAGAAHPRGGRGDPARAPASRGGASRDAQFAVFAGESIDEVKKVVWPTRKETMQTTAAVFAFVVVMAVFLWLTDKTLEWVLYDLILGWKKT